MFPIVSIIAILIGFGVLSLFSVMEYFDDRKKK